MSQFMLDLQRVRECTTGGGSVESLPLSFGGSSGMLGSIDATLLSNLHLGSADSPHDQLGTVTD